MEQTDFRPDNGLTIAIFAHILEYYGNIGVKHAIKDADGINELSVLARAIANRWTSEVEVFDGNVKDLQEAVKDLSITLDGTEKERDELVGQLAEIATAEKQTKDSKKKTTKKVANERESSK